MPVVKMKIERQSDKLGYEYLDSDEVEAEVWFDEDYLYIEVEGSLYKVPRIF